MRMLFALFLLLISGSAFADKEFCYQNDNSEACWREGGCYWEMNGCNDCTDDYPFSEYGATSTNQCYAQGPYGKTRKCYESGAWDTSEYGKGGYNGNVRIDYTTDTDPDCPVPNCNGGTCNFDCQNENGDKTQGWYCSASHKECSNTTGQCRCELNEKSCESSEGAYAAPSDKFKAWTGTGWSDCLIRQCTGGYHPEYNTNGMVHYCNAPGNECVKDTADCDEPGWLPKHGVSVEGGYTYGGKAQWKDNKWDLSKCTRTSDTLATDDSGTYTKTCEYGNGSWNTNCNKVYTKCNSGHYKKNNECIQARAGYYVNSTQDGEEQCPAGSTSDKGATAKCKCYMVVGTTRLCSSNNSECFELEGVSGDKIYWNGGC